MRPCDTLWMVSTRGMPYCSPQAHFSDLKFCVLDSTDTWQPTDLAAFLATDRTDAITVFWIHGNRESAGEAQQQGMRIYRKLTRCLACDAPLRFVIFSWPADRVTCGPIEDVRIKAGRTDAQSYYVASLIDQMGHDVPVSLAGFSFGARIATGAAHLLGGGILCGWTLDDRKHVERLPMHAALVAPALDNHWLLPGHRHGNALSQLAHLTVIYNSCDAALKRYRFIYGRGSNAQALGYTGVAGLGCLGIDRERIAQYDACCYVGKQHAWEPYTGSGALMSRLRAELMPE